MRKKIFTLQELYDYLQAQPNRSFQYSAKDEREELKILFDSKIAFKSNDSSDDTEGLLPTLPAVLHEHVQQPVHLHLRDLLHE